MGVNLATKGEIVKGVNREQMLRHITHTQGAMNVINQGVKGCKEMNFLVGCTLSQTRVINTRNWK